MKKVVVFRLLLVLVDLALMEHLGDGRPLTRSIARRRGYGRQINIVSVPF